MTVGPASRPGDEARAARAVSQLTTLLASGDLPPRMRDVCAQVAERLAAPVRMSVVGRPEARPVALANALLGGRVLPEIEGLPPAELRFSEAETWRAITANGAPAEMDARRFALCDPLNLALLQRTAPVPLLRQIALCVVTLEGDAAEERGALSWAVRDADMLLWCSVAPAEEAVLLATVPGALLDHAFLALGRRSQSGSAAARPATDPHADVLASGFVAAFPVAMDGAPDTALPIAAVDGLRAALLEHVSRGRREDLDFALMLLERYMPRQSGPAAAQIAARLGPAPVPDPVDPEHPGGADLYPAGDSQDLGAQARGLGVEAGWPASPPGADPAEPLTGAARIVELIAERACAVEAALPAEGAVPSADVLALCSDTLNEEASIADADAEDAADDLPDLLAEAADLMLLIQMEDSPGAVVDSLALLLQARHECEARLAA
ncbi:MAG: hypothetical protein AAGG09_04410 [Pseudomonadota bacterium]